MTRATGGKEKPSKKPPNTAFKQQRLKAWQPILTPKTVLPTFFIIGLVFLPIGIGLYVASDRVQQTIFDYTKCVNAPATFGTSGEGFPGGVVQKWQYTPATKTCSILYRIESTYTAPVFIYYRLTNFYQNHRRYVKSFDANQLKGEIVPTANLKQECNPLRQPSNSSSLQYYPCGLIADSMFTDDIGSPSLSDNDGNIVAGSQYVFTEDGIAWPSDATKYKLTKWVSEKPSEIPTNLVPPPRWAATWPDRFANGYNATNVPDLAKWERFQVWMRTAGLPNFRKLWGRNTTADMQAGLYRIDINDSYDVSSFEGTKSIVISTISVIGGKNPFLGVAYMAVGIICVVLGVAFLLRHVFKPRKLGDHQYLSWNQPQPVKSSGGAAGANGNAN